MAKQIDVTAGFRDSQIDVTAGFRDSQMDVTAGFQPSSPPLEPLQIKDTRKEAEDIFSMSQEIEIPINDLADNYDGLIADPQSLSREKPVKQFEQPQIGPYEPTGWQKFKNFFSSGRPSLPPDASNMERFDRAFDTAVGSPLRVFLKTTQGMTFNAGDFMWAGIKKIVPEDVWTDDVQNMTLEEAMDWAAGYDSSGFAKMVGEIGEFSGRLKTIKPLIDKGLPLPKSATVLDKMLKAGTMFASVSATEQAAKLGLEKIDSTDTDYGYEGAIAVGRDFLVGAVLSAVGQGVKAAWAKLTPNEYQKALKVLGLKKGATEDEINQAVRNFARKFHPDKVKGMEAEFQKVIQARDVLRQGETADIVFRGAKAKWTAPKQLPGKVKVNDGIVKSTQDLARESRLAYNTQKALLEIGTSNAESNALMQNQDFPQRVANLGRRFHAWMFTFGDAKQNSPGLFDQAMASYGKRNAGVEKAIGKVEAVIRNEIPLDEEMAANLAMAFEDKRLPTPEGQEGLMKGFNELFTQLEERSKTIGLFKRSFQERMLDEINSDIEGMQANLKNPKSSKKYREALKEKADIENMRYLPHTQVARNVVNAKYNSLPGKDRERFRQQMSALFKKRKGKLFLKDYLDAGLIEKKDIDIRRLATEALTSHFYRESMKDLFDYAEEQGFIALQNEGLREAGWLNQNELGISSPEFKGKLIHPVMGTVLDEMKQLRHRKGGVLRKVLGITKVAQFVKPTILWVYNADQKLFRGMWSANPAKEMRFTRDALKHVMEKSPLYHKANESNLFQFPYESNRHSIEREVSRMINEYSPHIPAIVKNYEKITGKPWPKNGAEIIEALFTAGHSAIGEVTWAGDKVQRMQSYLVLRDMGYPHRDAVNVASKGHGAYSALSPRLKGKLENFLFVYAFRFLMPIEMAKVITEPMKGTYDKFAKGSDIPRHKWNRWVKAIIGFTMIPVITDQYMKMRGYKQEGKALGPVAWKYKKELIVNGKKTEVVATYNNIINMPVKQWNRLTYTNPISPEPDWQESLDKAIKWEVHPLWRVLFWDIAQNRKSFGSGLPVWDPQESSSLKQVADTGQYIFGQLFRFWGNVMDATQEGQMTETEENQQKVIFKEGMNNLDKALINTFGYAYTRLPLDQRKGIMAKKLQNEISSRAFTINRRYKDEPQELKRRMDSLEEWANVCKNWIKKDMQ